MSRIVTPEPTPNPNAIRFALGEAALGGKARSFASGQEAGDTPWAAALFDLPGVVAVFAVKDFVTVTKSAEASWDAIVPRAMRLLADADLGA